MRKLIAGLKISVDAKSEGPEGMADWVDAWSEDYGLMSQIDTCLLGGGMYPGYEQYWTSIRNEPEKPVWITGNPPTPAELEWARFAARTPHYVLSSSLADAKWPTTRFVRRAEDVAALKRQPGKDIYLLGGARTTASLVDAGLVDELRLIVYPLIAGEGAALFATTTRRRALELRNVQPLSDGRVSLIYGIASESTGSRARPGSAEADGRYRSRGTRRGAGRAYVTGVRTFLEAPSLDKDYRVTGQSEIAHAAFSVSWSDLAALAGGRRVLNSGVQPSHSKSSYR